MARQLINPFLQKKPFSSYGEVELQKYSAVSSANLLPGLFDDSSSEVWEIVCTESKTSVFPYPEFILKSHNKESLEGKTPFWQAMEFLFGLTLTQSYLNSAYSYEYLSQHSALKIPQIYDTLNGGSNCAIVLEKIDAVSMSDNDINSQNIEKFAHHLASLHRQEIDEVGVIAPFSTKSNLSNPYLNKAVFWQEKVALTITTLARHLDLNSCYIDKALDWIQAVSLHKIVPVMMDLRWDQFAIQDGQLVGVFDLDAYVFAPIELDFVILEYLLTAEQAQVFCSKYVSITGQRIQLTEEQRYVYRVLFYLMNALGETDLEKWMNQPELFTG